MPKYMYQYELMQHFLRRIVEYFSGRCSRMNDQVFSSNLFLSVFGCTYRDHGATLRLGELISGSIFGGTGAEDTFSY